MKTDELTTVGAIFSLIVFTGIYLSANYKQNLQIEKQNKYFQELRKEYTQAQALVIQLDAESKEIQSTLSDMLRTYDSMQEDLASVQTLIKIKEDLRGYSIEEQAIALALAWTESNWRINPDHKDNGFTVGPCGVTEYWIDYLNELGTNRYSFSSCIEIYQFYKDKHNNKYLAIKAYKGIDTKTYLIDKTLKLRDKILKILKKNI